MKNKRAQSAIELVIVIAAVMFFVVLMINAIQDNTADKTRQNRNLAVQEIADTVESEISLAQSSSDGYYRNFTLPMTLLSGVPYNVILDANLVYVYTLDNKTTYAIPVSNYSGNVKLGVNNIQKVNGLACLNFLCGDGSIYTPTPP
jgi:hypothetical protein